MRSQLSPLCRYHRKVQARHGHYAQTAVTVRELAPFIGLVKQRRKANPKSPAWALLDARWAAIVATADQTIRDWENGRPDVRYRLQAAKHVQTLAKHVRPEQVWEVALAVFIYARQHPQRFRSDRALGFQLVRRVRGLSLTNAGSYWDHKTQKTKRVYRDPAPKAVEVFAGWLTEAFGAPGLQLADLLARSTVEAEAAREAERKRLAEAIGSLQ